MLYHPTIFSCWKCYIFSVGCFNVFGDFIWRFSSSTNNAGFIGNYISHLHLLFIQCLNLCLNYSIIVCHQDKVNMKIDYSRIITIYHADIFVIHYHLCTSVFRTWFIKFVCLHNVSGNTYSYISIAVRKFLSIFFCFA